MNNNKFSLQQSFSYGWNTFLGNVPFFVLISLLSFGSVALVSVIIAAILIGITAPFSSISTEQIHNLTTCVGPSCEIVIKNVITQSPLLGTKITIIGLITAIIGYIVYLGFDLGYKNLYLRMYDNRSVSLKDLFAYLNPRSIFHVTVASLITVIAIIPGFVLFIIPGIYISARLMFAPFFIADSNETGINALKKSYALTNEHTGKLMLYILLLGLITLSGNSLTTVLSYFVKSNNLIVTGLQIGVQFVVSFCVTSLYGLSASYIFRKLQ